MADVDHDLLLRMSTKVDAIHEELTGTAARPGIITRVDSLESWRDTSRGWAAGFIAALTALAALFGWHLHGGK